MTASRIISPHHRLKVTIKPRKLIKKINKPNENKCIYITKPTTVENENIKTVNGHILYGIK